MNSDFRAIQVTSTVKKQQQKKQHGIKYPQCYQKIAIFFYPKSKIKKRQRNQPAADTLKISLFFLSVIEYSTTGNIYRLPSQGGILTFNS